MSPQVLLDTGFLITLADSTRPHHSAANQYYQFFLSASVPMYLSTLVAAEFSVMQPVTDLPLHSFITLPFNLPHGILAGTLANAFPRTPQENRVIVKEDIKIIAQAAVENIDFILTEDVRTLASYCDRMRAAGRIGTKTIALSAGFDTSHFSNGGQRVLAMAAPPQPV